MKDHPLEATHDDDRERGRYMGEHKPEISGKDIDNCKASLPEPRTLGQLNLIVDGIEGVK